MAAKPAVVVISSRKALLDKVKSLAKGRQYTYATKTPDEAKSFVPACTAPAIIYLDASQFTVKDVERLCENTAKHVHIGVLDSSAVVDDPAEMLRKGAVDYIGKKLLQDGIQPKRIRSVIDFCDFPETVLPKIAADWKLSGKNWKNVRSDQEYTFCFMFVEIDLIDEWKRKSGAAHLDEVRSIFQKHIQQFAAGLSGKIWMWMDLGGLILFPFDGESCNPILSGVRTVLNRTIISADHYGYSTSISYRIALHIGNTVYKARGNTSTIVSDAVNFLFHFGRQFAEPGSFYLTEPVIPFIPEGLKDIFVSAGIFEDVEICRMRLPVG